MAAITDNAPREVHEPARGFDLDVAILGAGTAGMAAYREVVKRTDRVALIDGGPLGTTCARVGCMPSKLLIAAADAAHGARGADLFGVRAGPVEVDGRAVMARLRRERDRFVAGVEDAVAGFADRHVIREHGRLVDDHTVELEGGRRLTARAVVIATGSRPAVPPPAEAAGDRLLTTDDLFERDDLPRSAAVLGAGVIGLEIGQALHRLGVRVRLFGHGGAVGALTDPELTARARAVFGAELSAHFDAQTEIERDGEGVVVRWREGEEAGEERFEVLLAATGRRPNLDGLGLEATSLDLDEHGAPRFDPLSARAVAGEGAMIFVAGDAAPDAPLLHEAADAGRIAGENAARAPHVHRRARRTGLTVLFCDPGIAVAGRGRAELEEAGIPFAVGEASFEEQGRARVLGANRGALRVYGERDTGRLLGAEMVCPRAEHLAHLLAWAIEGGLTAEEALRRPFYHPCLEEGVRTALRELSHALGFEAKPPLACIDCGPGG